MKQAHVFIPGTVQGVGYRYFVNENARRLGLTGWVCNTPARNALPEAAALLRAGTHSVAGGDDGSVEAVFQGEEKAIEQMIELCKKGPFMAEVKEVAFAWEEAEEIFNNFIVR